MCNWSSSQAHKNLPEPVHVYERWGGWGVGSEYRGHVPISVWRKSKPPCCVQNYMPYPKDPSRLRIYQTLSLSRDACKTLSIISCVFFFCQSFERHLRRKNKNKSAYSQKKKIDNNNNNNTKAKVLFLFSSSLSLFTYRAKK